VSTRAPNAPPDADAPNAARLNAALRTELGTLAWLSIDDGLARGAWLSELAARQPMALDLRAVSPALREHGGCFVTLHRDGELRGCIGTTRPYQPLARDVVYHAFAAAFRDPRFAPLNPEERAGLQLEVSVLGPPSPAPCSSEERLRDYLQPGVHGLILRSGKRVATFLPSVWDGVERPLDFIRHLLRKAGMRPGTWPGDLEAFTYEVQKWQAPPPASS